MKHIRHTQGFSCEPGSGFLARCPNPECQRLLLFGQICVCGTNSGHPHIPGQCVKLSSGREVSSQAMNAIHAYVRGHMARENTPRLTCGICQFEYPENNPERHTCNPQ